jgi:hypothetical protein
MARLRINQGLNLTLDASTTDFIVKSLSGPNGPLLLNGRNWSVEVRIDEDSSGGDTFRVTKGSNGSTTLLTVENSGNLNIGGFELKLGTSDQSTRGNTGSSRVLVKDSNATLAINYAGDFSGGARVDGPGLGVGGVNYVYNNNTSYQIPGADANAKWLIIRDTTSGSGVISFNNTKDADGNILGSLVWTRESGQSDGHRQVAGIVAVQSGTGATAGSEMRFYVKGSSGPFQALTINKGGFVGINNTSPDYRLVLDESTKNIAAYIRKTNNGRGGGALDGPTLLVENSYGNHSWGNLAEFRIDSSGNADAPNITFTAGWTSTGWAVGMAAYNDSDFGIASNRGWRFNGWGTLQLRVKPDGQLITRGTITPGISSGFAGHINSSGPIKFSNGSATQEIYVRKIRASASWATNDANDPGDGGGFFSGNLIVNGTITGNLNGNASTATKLQTARSISLGGSLSGSTYFDGNADVTINASINSGAVGTTQLADNAVTTQKIADGAVTASKLAPGAATRMFQATIGDGTNSTYTVTHNLDTTNVEVSLILLSTNEKIGAKVVVLNSNQIQVSFISPISTNSVKVVVIG